MSLIRPGRSAALLFLLLPALAAGTALARDVYKAFLDPGIPRHQAVLDTLSRLEADPKNAGLKNDLACLIAQEGFWRDALRELDEAAELDKKDSRPFFNAGLVQARRSEWGGARSYFDKAVKRDPGNWPAWWMLGFAEEQLGSVGPAVAAYKKSLRVDMSLFDPRVNPYAAWTQLKMQVYLESYDERRVRALLPSSEQLSDPERVNAFFQHGAKPPSRAAAAAPAPVPTIEPKTGPVITSVPPTSGSVSPRGDAGGPAWNPQAATYRRRGEGQAAPVPPQPAAPAPPAAAPPPPAPVPAGAAAAGKASTGTEAAEPPGLGIAGPAGVGGPGFGAVPAPSPTPAPR